ARGGRMTNPAANWYPDPHDPNQLRYWDGHQWTEHRAPKHPPAAPPPQAASPPVQPVQPPAAKPSRPSVPLFGARNVARQQSDELDHLRAEMQRLGGLCSVRLQRRGDEPR